MIIPRSDELTLAYDLLKFCPQCGSHLEQIVNRFENTKICRTNPGHGIALYPSTNEHGDIVMVFDPHRVERA